MLLLIGLIICIFFNAGNGDIVVYPSGSPVYFSVGVPASISCTAQVQSGNVEDSIVIVQLANGTDARTALACSTSRSSASFEYLFPSSFGNVSLSRSYPQQSAVNCTYTLPAISDGTYSCIATYLRLPAEVKSFDVITTKQPDDVFINNVNSAEITATEGDSINVTCIAINSKPAYSLSWTPLDIANAETSSTSQATINGYTNSTTSLILVAADSMDGRVLTCSASSPTPVLGSRSATALFNIYYGPSEPPQSSASTSNGTFYCPLVSNPNITNYIWRLDNVTQAQCTTQSCTLSQQEVQAHLQVTCEGQNPQTNQFAKATMNIVWLASSTGAAAVTGSVKSVDQSQVLSDGAIAGIVIGAVAFVALVIIVPVAVCMKRKRSKGPSAGSDTNASRRSMPPASSGPSSSRPYSFENTSGGGHKSPLSAQPDVVRNSGFSPSALDPGQPHKAPSTPPPAYPGAMDMIDQKPRSRKPIALYDTALDDAYPNQTNASYMPSPKY